MEWTQLTLREKTEYIIQNVLKWPYFQTWELAHVAKWALENGGTYPYAFWNEQQACISVFYQPLEDAQSFRPLESLDDAWQIVRMMNNSQNPAFPDYQIYIQFIDKLTKLVGSDLFFDLFYCDKDGDHLTPERICHAAYKATEAEIG